MFKFIDSNRDSLQVAIIGVGTVGCNILNKIENIYSDQNYIDFLYVHSSGDFLTKKTSREDDKIELRKHIHFYENEIRNRASDKDIVFLVSALGGETGSSVSPFIAKIVAANSALCIGLFSFPFAFEGKYKNIKARRAYKAIRDQIDSLVCIENDSFLEANLRNKSLTDINNLFRDSNDHFIAVIRGIVGLLYKPGMINVELADLRVVFSKMGLCTVGYSTQEGVQRTDAAVKNLLTSPALKNRDISKAAGWIINITSRTDVSLEEYSIVGSNVEEFCRSDATVIVGTCINQELIDDIQVTAIATGLPDFLTDETLDDNENYDFVTISRSIEFEPHHVSTGLSILTYFNEFVHQKYSGTATKVRIEQNNTSVILIIETPSGEVELIEKSLKEFGLVVVGEMQASEVLERDMDIERLQMKLEMAAMELRYNEKILLLYKSENDSNKSRITALEDQLMDLQKTISKSLSTAQSHISKQINIKKGIPSEIANLINRNLDKELTENLKELIKNELNKHKNDKGAILSIKKLVENSVYGVTGNSLYTFILHAINNLPK